MGFWDIFKSEKKKKTIPPGFYLSDLPEITNAPNGKIRRKTWPPGSVIHFFRTNDAVKYFDKTANGFAPYVQNLSDFAYPDWEIVSVELPVTSTEMSVKNLAENGEQNGA